MVVCEKVVGMDLVTTNSAVAAMEGGKPTIVTNAEGQRTTPSVVAYTKNGDKLVGQIAKRQAVVNPENTFFSVKRFTGRKMSEVDEEAKQVGKFITFPKSFYCEVNIFNLSISKLEAEFVFGLVFTRAYNVNFNDLLTISMLFGDRNLRLLCWIP